MRKFKQQKKCYFLTLNKLKTEYICLLKEKHELFACALKFKYMLKVVSNSVCFVLIGSIINGATECYDFADIAPQF